MLPAAGATDLSVPTGAEVTHSQDDSYYSDKMNSSQTGSMSGRPKVIVKERKHTKQSEAPASQQDTELS